jgi:hypothetical protein
VIAIDPALLEEGVLDLPNVRHLRFRAEQAVQATRVFIVK